MAIRKGVLVVLAFPVLLTACGKSSQQAGPPNGPELFKKNCATCHGVDGKGKIAKIDMTTPTWQKSLTDTGIAKVIKGGVPKKGMPTFGPALRDEQISAIIKDAIRKFGKEGK